VTRFNVYIFLSVFYSSADTRLGYNSDFYQPSFKTPGRFGKVGAPEARTTSSDPRQSKRNPETRPSLLLGWRKHAGLNPSSQSAGLAGFFFFGFGSGVGFLFRTRPVLCSGRKKKRNRNPVGYRVGLSLVLQCSGLNIRLHRYSCRPI